MCDRANGDIEIIGTCMLAANSKTRDHVVLTFIRLVPIPGRRKHLAINFFKDTANCAISDIRGLDYILGPGEFLAAI